MRIKALVLMVGGPRSSPGQEVVALGQLWQGFLTTPENLNIYYQVNNIVCS